MKDDKLIITVSGKHMSGKSHLLFLLKKFLIEEGFDTEHDGGIDFQSEFKFDTKMTKSVDKYKDYLKNNKKIIFEEKQLPKNY